MEWYFKQFIKEQIEKGVSDEEIAAQVPYSVADVAFARAMHNGPMSYLQLNKVESLE
ncbi:hypothetical protein [Sporosarcina sp. FSL K6-2383]|uniref:hypothetical protein n=1 Tax=Sporosarcina sp. FSL K6-2383 TaxID=2921556 RepID=UPI00315A1D5B